MNKIVKLEKIQPDPNQPRSYFDPEAMDEIIESMKLKGFVEKKAIEVISNGKGVYTVHNGGRRYKAAVEAGLTEIPVTIVKFKSELEKFTDQVADNLNRADFTPLEMADAAKTYISKGGDLDGMVKAFGRPKKFLEDCLAIANLPEIARDALARKKITKSVAIRLTDMPVKADMEKAVDLASGRKSSKAIKILDKYAADVLQTKTDTGKGKFTSEEENAAGKIYGFLSKTMGSAVEAGLIENCDVLVSARSRKIDEIEAVAKQYAKLAAAMTASVEKYRAEHGLA